MQLVRPELKYLPSYLDALQRGWSPDNIRGADAANEEIEAIGRDAQAFIDGLEDPDAKGSPVKLPNGATAQRLPSFRRWMWDGEFCGSVGFRWQPGTSELPPHCPGHVGYAVVPWKRRLGYATSALRRLLQEIKPYGLAYIEVTTDMDNIPSQRVVTACGGWLAGRTRIPEIHGDAEGYLYRIDLSAFIEE